MSTQTLSYPDYDLVIEGSTLVKIIEHKDMADIVIPECIVSIKDLAARSLKAASISFPNGLEDMGFCNFECCPNVTEIIIPPLVEYLSLEIFDDCHSLKRLFIGKSLYRFSNKSNCPNLTEIIVDPANKDFTSIDGVVFSKDLTELIFCPPNKQGSYKVPVSVTKLEGGAFNGSQLSEILLPHTINHISNIAFSNAPLLKKIDCYTPGIPYQPSGFDVVLPSSLNFVPPSLISNTPHLHTVFLHRGIRSVKFSAFQNSCLTDLIIEEGSLLDSVGGDAFEDSRLSRFFIPPSLHSISSDFINECPTLASFSVHPSNSTFSVRDGVLFKDNGTTLFRCPETKSGVYTVPDGVIRIEYWAFSNCQLNEIILPKSLRYIGKWAFTKCKSLHKLRLPDSIKDFYHYSFDDNLKIIGPDESHNKQFLNLLNDLIVKGRIVDCPALERRNKLAALTKIYFTANVSTALSKDGIKFAIVEREMKDSSINFDGLKTYYIHAHYSSSERDIQRLLSKIRSYADRFVVIIIRLG